MSSALRAFHAADDFDFLPTTGVWCRCPGPRAAVVRGHAGAGLVRQGRPDTEVRDRGPRAHAIGPPKTVISDCDGAALPWNLLHCPGTVDDGISLYTRPNPMRLNRFFTGHRDWNQPTLRSVLSKYMVVLPVRLFGVPPQHDVHQCGCCL